MSIEEYRALTDRTARFPTRIPKGVEVNRIDVDTIPAAWISPSDADPDKVMLHFHGGGYVTGGIDSHLMMCIPMAQTLNRKVLLPDYRIAPEHPFPAALDDALKIYRWLLAQGYHPKNMIVSGDSAGGGLALATVLSMRDSHEPLPAALICISPWVDLLHTGESHATNAQADVVLTTDVLKEWALVYAGESNLKNPLVSPVYADYHGFPPLLIQVDSGEVLLDDAKMLANKARADGVDVTLKIWDGMWHVWHAVGTMLPEGREAFEEIGMFVRRLTAKHAKIAKKNEEKASRPSRS